MLDGLCGWIGFAGEADPSAALAGMASALPAGGNGSAASDAAAQGGLHQSGGSLAAADDVVAAIDGFPRWTDPALAQTAEAEGHAAALLTAYRRDGRGLLDHLAGPFSLAVVDRATASLLLAVDRFGVHTLCYAHRDGDGLAFGTTADAVRTHPRVPASIRPQALFDFLRLMVVPSPGTIYREQEKLLPGQYLEVREGAMRTGFYWHMTYRPEDAGPDRHRERLFDTLRQAVGRSLEGFDAAAAGAFLSGGLDSSSVAGLLAEAAPGTRTFTIGFDEARYNELHYAHVTAKHFATRQEDYILTPKDVLSCLADIARHFDEPFGNSSVVPVYYCAKLAADRGVSVMLAGDGGDEIFAGNMRYAEQARMERYRRLMTPVGLGLLETLLRVVPGGQSVPLIRKARSLVERLRMGIPDRADCYHPLAQAAARGIVAEDLLAEVDPDHALASLYEAFARTPSGDLLHRMMHMDLKITLADNDLRKVSGACRMVGLPVRYPLLDEDVVAFSGRVPPSSLLNGTQIRHFYKQAMTGFLPDEVITKKKHGFGMPSKDWPRTDPDLRQLTGDSLSALRRRGYFDPAFIDRLLDGHARGEPTEWDGLAWDLVMFELWYAAREAGERSRATTAAGA